MYVYIHVHVHTCLVSFQFYIHVLYVNMQVVVYPMVNPMVNCVGQ